MALGTKRKGLGGVRRHSYRPIILLLFFFSGENDVFGDNICHEPTVGQSAVDVFALTYCDLHWIQRDALIEVLEFYPDFANKFTRNLVLSYNLRDEVLNLKKNYTILEHTSRFPRR